jgi:hypothetical protein
VGKRVGGNNTDNERIYLVKPGDNPVYARKIGHELCSAQKDTPWLICPKCKDILGYINLVTVRDDLKNGAIGKVGLFGYCLQGALVSCPYCKATHTIRVALKALETGD